MSATFDKNNFSDIIREAVKELQHLFATDAGQWAMDTTEKFEDIKDKIGDNPKITGIEEAINEAQEIDIRKKKILLNALFVMGVAFLINYLLCTNQESVYQVFSQIYEVDKDIATKLADIISIVNVFWETNAMRKYLDNGYRFREIEKQGNTMIEELIVKGNNADNKKGIRK